jgi:hypothetical protein
MVFTAATMSVNMWCKCWCNTGTYRKVLISYPYSYVQFLTTTKAHICPNVQTNVNFPPIGFKKFCSLNQQPVKSWRLFLLDVNPFSRRLPGSFSQPKKKKKRKSAVEFVPYFFIYWNRRLQRWCHLRYCLEFFIVRNMSYLLLLSTQLLWIWNIKICMKLLNEYGN